MRVEGCVADVQYLDMRNFDLARENCRENPAIEKRFVLCTVLMPSLDNHRLQIA